MARAGGRRRSSGSASSPTAPATWPRVKRSEQRKTGSQVLFRSTIAKMLAPAEPAERAVLFDDGTGHSLDTIELEHVVSRIQEIIGRPLELLGMDACLMASLEVAYQVRHSARFYVASEELVPGHSWPYDLIFGELAAHPEWTGAELSRAIVRHYTDFYRANPPRAG